MEASLSFEDGLAKLLEALKDFQNSFSAASRDLHKFFQEEKEVWLRSKAMEKETRKSEIEVQTPNLLISSKPLYSVHKSKCRGRRFARKKKRLQPLCSVHRSRCEQCWHAERKSRSNCDAQRSGTKKKSAKGSRMGSQSRRIGNSPPRSGRAAISQRRLSNPRWKRPLIARQRNRANKERRN